MRPQRGNRLSMNDINNQLFIVIVNEYPMLGANPLPSMKIDEFTEIVILDKREL